MSNSLFTRQWSSIYEALQDSRPEGKKLMLLYIKQLEKQVPATEHILVAIDHTAWGRPDAKTLKDRTHEYQAGVILGHYHCCTNELGVENHRFQKQQCNSSKFANRPQIQC